MVDYLFPENLKIIYPENNHQFILKFLVNNKR